MVDTYTRYYLYQIIIRGDEDILTSKSIIYNCAGSIFTSPVNYIPSGVWMYLVMFGIGF